MIIDTIENAISYERLHPKFKQAFDFLRHTNLTNLEIGKHEIDGTDVFAIIAQDDGRARTGAKLEIHRSYIDIQVVITGDEEIGYAPLSACSNPVAPYDTDRDLQFFTDQPESWLAVPLKSFAIFFPHDAHAPLAGTGVLRKIVIKVLA